MYRKREWRRKTEWNKAEWWQAGIEWKGSRIGLEGGRRVRRSQRCGGGLKERGVGRRRKEIQDEEGRSGAKCELKCD